MIDFSMATGKVIATTLCYRLGGNNTIPYATLKVIAVTLLPYC